MAKPLRVLVVTSQLPPDIGGTAVHAAEISRGLARLGHAVTLAVRDRDPAGFQAPGLEAVRIDARRGLVKPLRLRRAQARLLALARERRVDVVFFAYTVVGLGDVYGRLARAGIPYVVGVHGFRRRDLADPAAIARRRRKWGLGGASRVIGCSDWLCEQIAPLVQAPERLVRVHPGIDPGLAERVDPERVAAARARLGLEGRTVLLCLGRFVPRKNFDAILRVLPSLAARFPELALLLVGDGAEEARLRALAAELGVAGRVVFAGRVAPAEVGVYHELADVFATVSRTRPEDDTSETFGLVYLEAGLCGRPVVAGREGGVPEVVLDGETGLLASGGDPAGIEAAIARLLGDPELRRRLGEAARARALRDFTWDRAARETAEVLRQAARAAGEGSGPQT